MKRRTFLRAAGAALGGAAVGAGLSPTDVSGSKITGRTAGPDAPALHLGQSPDVAVVGAGAFGAWTALYLLQKGASVTLVDAYGPGNYRSTSGGDSRQIRAGYGDREMYTEWALEAFRMWRRWERALDEELMVTCGRLSFAPERTAGMEAEARVLDAHGVEHELLTPEEVRRRWPQISVDGVGAAHFEPGAATIRAARAMRAVGERVVAEGGRLSVARAHPGPSTGGRMDSLRLTGEGLDSGALSAGVYVFACGPWLPEVFPGLLADRITVPRRDVFFFGPPEGDDRFTWPNLPNFSEGSAHVYGFPDLDGRGVKVAPYGGVDPFDPDADERIVAWHWLKRARAWLARRFPALSDQPVVHSRVCQLENTADEHFLIDRHPEMENVLIAGGGTGHGFKHGPKLGDYISDRALGREGDPELARTFSLTRDRS